MNKQQKDLDAWFTEKSWPYWQPLTIIARLAEEVGELARVVNHLHGEKPKKSTESEQELQDEVGDILFTLACMANREGFDLDECLEKSLKKVKDRDANRF